MWEEKDQGPYVLTPNKESIHGAIQTKILGKPIYYNIYNFINDDLIHKLSM